MSILLAFLYLALMCIGLGYLIVTWALAQFGIVVPPRWLQVIAAIILVCLLIWFVQEIIDLERRRHGIDDYLQALQWFVVLKTADGKAAPWTCSHSDLLAGDWEKVPLAEQID